MATTINDEKNNRIINDIMSGHAPVFLLSPTDSIHLDFLPELCNNYRYSFVWDVKAQGESNFVYHFLRKAVFREEIKRRYLSYFCCKPISGEKVVLQKILETVATYKNDVLLILGSMEEYCEERNFSLLRFLLENCPENLKIVLVAKNFLPISYAMTGERFPRVIPLSEQENDDDFCVEFSEKEKDFLSEIASFEVVEEDFCDYLYAGGKELLMEIYRKNRKLILKVDNLFYIHPKVSVLLNLPKYDENKSKNDYINYLLKVGKIEIVLEKCIKYGWNEGLEKAAERFFEIGFSEYALSSIFHKKTKEKIEEDYSDLIRHITRKETVKTVYPKNKIAQRVYSLCLREEKAFGSLIDEMSTADEETFLRDISFIRYLSYEQKRELYSHPFFYEKCIGISDCGRWDKHFLFCSFLENVSDVVAMSGEYGKSAKFLRKIKEMYPYYRFNCVQTWRFCFGSEIDEIEKLIAAEGESSEKRLLCTVFEMMRGDKVKAGENLLKVAEERYYSEYFLSKAFQSILYSELQSAEWGGKMASFFGYRCAFEKGDGGACLATALAYSQWKKGDKSAAMKTLSEIDESSFGSSVFHLLYHAVECNCILNSDSVLSQKNSIESLFSYIKKYGYTNIVMAFYDCFLPLITFADAHGFCPDFLLELQRVSGKKNQISEKTVRVRFFGEPLVFLDKEEIVWKTKKCKELFLLYLLFPDGIDRNRILENLWDGYVYSSSVNNLKTTNNLLRKTLQKYGIPFGFSYQNNRYKLTLEKVEDDYTAFRKGMRAWEDIPEIGRKTIELNRLGSVCEQGFATGYAIPVFRQIDKEIRSEFGSDLQTLVLSLLQTGDYIGAGRYVERMERMGIPTEIYKKEIEKKVFRV